MAVAGELSTPRAIGAGVVFACYTKGPPVPWVWGCAAQARRCSLGIRFVNLLCGACQIFTVCGSSAASSLTPHADRSPETGNHAACTVRAALERHAAAARSAPALDH